MEELFDLPYKDEVDAIKDEPDFEELGDAKYLEHPDMRARLYWAFRRPSGSCARQISDEEPLVSIMAFNHSRLGALERFELLHKDVVPNESLRIKIQNRARMLFRALVDDDFKELNKVLDLVPVFLDTAVDQLKNGRKWNEIPADVVEATILLQRADRYDDEVFLESLHAKLKDVSSCDLDELKRYIDGVLVLKENVDTLVLRWIYEDVLQWLTKSDLHILQQKSVENLARKLLREE